MNNSKFGRRLSLTLLAVAFILSVALSFAFIAPYNRAFADHDISAGEDFTYYADKGAAYAGVSFEYKIYSADDTVINVCFLDEAWANYYGYFTFSKDGASEQYDGVSTKPADDGFVFVYVDFAAATKIVGSRPDKIRLMYLRGDFSNANGVIKNITFLEKGLEESSEAEETQTFDGKKYLAGWNSYIYAPRSLLYEKVSFEYKVSKVGEEDSFGICLLDDNNSNYFGYYYFGSKGLVSGYDNTGVTVNQLDDGYYRVVMYVPQLKRTNQTSTTNYAPKKINSIFLRDVWTNDDVYIRNVSFIKSSGFSMQSGAAMRLERPYGIKFKAVIPQAQFDADALYGMVIIPANYLQKYSLSGDYIAKLEQKGVEYKNAYVQPKIDENYDYYIESYLGGLGESDLDTEYVGIAYKEVGGVYTYATNIEGTKRAISSVAAAAVEDVRSFWDHSISGQNVIRNLVGTDRQTSYFAVNGFDSIENFKKDEQIPESQSLTLYAAKGEGESGEIVLTANSSLQGKKYIITPYDLVHEDGVTTLSKKNFTFYNGNYTLVTSNYRHVVYPKNGATDLGTGYSLVNALVPFYAAVNADETIFDLSGGANQTIVVDFKVPPTQKAGRYHGSFRIDVPGVGYRDIAVDFTVYDFALPEENAAKNVFAIPVNYLSDVYYEYSGYDSELYRELYDYLLDFNINAGRVPAVPSYGDLDWDKYLNMLLSYAQDPRVSTINLYSGFDFVTYTYTYDYEKKVLWWTETEERTDTYTDLIVLREYDRTGSIVNNAGEKIVYDSYGLRTIFTKLALYAIENDYDIFKKIVINSPQNDEPSDAKAYAAAILSYNAVRRSIDYVLSGAGIDWTGHEDIRASLDDVPFLVTTDPSDECVAGNNVLDNVKSRSAYIPADELNARRDITIEYKYLKDFIALIAAFDSTDKPTSAARLYSYLDNKPEHVHVWWYTCCLSVNPYYCYGLNSNSVLMRSNRWAQFGMGVEGELYCAVNNWFSLSDDESITVLTEEEVWQGMSNQAGLIEDGVLIYPNVSRYEDEDFKFCPTYRLYTVRESIDDYNYLCYAQKLIARLGDATERAQAAARLENIVSSLYDGVRSVNCDAQTLRSARAAIAELILSLV